MFSSEQLTALISGLIMMMTASQLQDARMLIPGAFELNAPPHRAPAAAVLPVVDVENVGARAAKAETTYVVAAPSSPRTPLAHAAAFLRDAVLIAGIIYGVALVPGFAVRGLEAAAALILKAIGRQ